MDAFRVPADDRLEYVHGANGTHYGRRDRRCEQRTAHRSQRLYRTTENGRGDRRQGQLFDPKFTPGHLHGPI